MQGIEIPKQRGIYSEILTTEDTENLRVSFPSTTSQLALFAFIQKVSTFGPNEKALCKINEV